MRENTSENRDMQLVTELYVVSAFSPPPHWQTSKHPLPHTHTVYSIYCAPIYFYNHITGKVAAVKVFHLKKKNKIKCQEMHLKVTTTPSNKKREKVTLPNFIPEMYLWDQSVGGLQTSWRNISARPRYWWYCWIKRQLKTKVQPILRP